MEARIEPMLTTHCYVVVFRKHDDIPPEIYLAKQYALIILTFSEWYPSYLSKLQGNTIVDLEKQYT